MVIAAHGRGQYLIIRCCWAFGTGCLQKKAEPRTLTDMTFLKFAAIYVSLLPLFLFYISPASLFLAFFFPRTHSTLPHPVLCLVPSSSRCAVVSLLRRFSSISSFSPLPSFSSSSSLSSASRRFDLTFPSLVLFRPLVPTPYGVHRLVSTS